MHKTNVNAQTRKTSVNTRKLQKLKKKIFNKITLEELVCVRLSLCVCLRGKTKQPRHFGRMICTTKPAYRPLT